MKPKSPRGGRSLRGLLSIFAAIAPGPRLAVRCGRHRFRKDPNRPRGWARRIMRQRRDTYTSGLARRFALKRLARASNACVGAE